MLKYGASATVGAIAGATGVFGRTAAASTHQAPGHGAAAGDPPLVPAFTHRGRRVEILGRSDRAQMIIDGRQMPHHVFMREDNGMFHSHMLPFTEYRDGRKLAEDLVDADARRLCVL